MFANHIEIEKRMYHIENEIAKIDSREEEWPSGELICAKNDKHYKWYLHHKGKTVYLPKKEEQLARSLALKKYCYLHRQELQEELEACRNYIRRSDCKNTQIQKMLDNIEYERLLGEQLREIKGKQYECINNELKNWENADYERNKNHPEKLIVKATNGKFVRSKSEAIIDKTLSVCGIPFRYEEKVILGGIALYPDFTIRHPRTGQVYYWEHMGMMDHSEYVDHACQKIKIYCENGIIPTVNLILTFETKEYPLGIDYVESIVREYFM